jgi:hypothetical protein
MTLGIAPVLPSLRQHLLAGAGPGWIKELIKREARVWISTRKKGKRLKRFSGDFKAAV